MNSRYTVSLALLFALALFANTAVYSAPFPLNFDLDSLHKADAKPESFKDRIVAFKGRITIIKQLPDARQYFFVQFHNPNPKSEGIWVSSLVNTKPTDLLVGHDIAVLAYFELTNSEDKAVSAIHKKAYHANGFCIANATSQMAMYAKDVNSFCMQWQNGTIPTASTTENKVELVKPAKKP